MEFPRLGQNCNEKSCKQLDFLPIVCDACSLTFCKDHVKYESHRCSEAYRKDNQVPTCPLCSKPIPIFRGESADTKVSQHIDTDCQSDPAKERRGKVYTNKCSFKGCKQKELVPVKCDKCHKNFCLRHRHELDHVCAGFQDSGNAISMAGVSAITRVQSQSRSNSRPQQTTLPSIGVTLDRQRANTSQGNNNLRAMQAGLTEDEAFARAIQLSMASDSTSQDQRPLTVAEQEDLALAQAIAASEQEGRTQNNEWSDDGFGPLDVWKQMWSYCDVVMVEMSSRSAEKKESRCSMS